MQVFKGCFDQRDCNFDDVYTKLATPDLPEITVFWNKDDVAIS